MKATRFHWPNGKRAALSLTFDDARLSQVDRCLPILDAHGVKATFYVSPDNVKQRVAGWRRAIANGHEIGNHTLTHPCSGNFPWSRRNALEDYTLTRMEKELTAASGAIKKLLGVTPATFAYPCGQTFVGRGARAKSYVPLIARHFLAGRGYPSEWPNDPVFCDFAQLNGIPADGATFEQLHRWIDDTLQTGGWLILVAHEVGGTDRLTLAPEVLEKLCRFAQDPANELWTDTVAAVATHVAKARRTS